ncbi:MAG: putative MFS-type transporter, partial [Thermoleophilia bacterium]|nr:putative MFS-type transporter [Thermoleophilia bacterium]
METADVARAGRIRMLLTIGMANALVAFVHFGLAAAGPVLRGGLDIGNAGLGWLLASAPAGLMFGTFAWGHLADQIGERRALTIAYSIATATLTGAALVGGSIWRDSATLASSPWLLVLLCILLVATGAAGSAAHSAGGRAIVEAFPPHMHARVLAIRHTFIPLGGTVGGVTMPSLLRHGGLGWALAGAALFAAALAVALSLSVPRDLPARHDADGVALVTGPSPL